MSPEMLRAICKSLPVEAATKWASALTLAAEEFDIDSHQNMCMWLPQLCHESMCFTHLTENLNYSSKRLAEVWPSRFAVDVSVPMALRQPNDLAISIGGKPELIANSVYANRMGNGSYSSGDGWRYRGRYPLQLTGRDAYEQCNADIGIPDIEYPDLLLQDIEGMARVCGWFWQWKGLRRFADKGDFRGVCTAWNGGSVGMHDRDKWRIIVKGAITSYG